MNHISSLVPLLLERFLTVQERATFDGVAPALHIVSFCEVPSPYLIFTISAKNIVHRQLDVISSREEVLPFHIFFITGSIINSCGPSSSCIPCELRLHEQQIWTHAFDDSCSGLCIAIPDGIDDVGKLNVEVCPAKPISAHADNGCLYKTYCI